VEFLPDGGQRLARESEEDDGPDEPADSPHRPSKRSGARRHQGEMTLDLRLAEHFDVTEPDKGWTALIPGGGCPRCFRGRAATAADQHSPRSRESRFMQMIGELTLETDS